MADVCAVCLQTTAKTYCISCNNCKKWFHTNCVNLTKEKFNYYAKEYKKSSGEKDLYVCPTCISKSEVKNARRGSVSSENEPTLLDLFNKLDSMEKKYDKLFKKYEEQMEINNKMQSEIQNIQLQLDVLAQEKNHYEQKSLANNVIISGIPIVSQQEDLNNIINQICTTVGKPTISPTDMKCFRIGRREVGASPPIKVEFASKSLREKFIYPKKNLFNITTKDLGYQENKKIFINEDLTKLNQELYKAALKFKKDNGYKFLWVGNGLIKLRKEEGSKITVIKSIADIEKLKN